MKRDTVFSDKRDAITGFQFDDEVAAVFDDMVSRSVPFYNEIHRIILDLLDRVFKNQGPIYDLGCSTGSTISIIAKHLEKKGITPQFIGVDNSRAMLDKCEEKLKEHKVDQVRLHCQNIEDVSIHDAEVVLMNYTMQFIPTEKRQALLKKVYDGLRPGAMFILSEKINCTESSIHELVTELYYDFKRRNGYSELEISQKREALENVLVPLTPKEQITNLKSAGFEKSEMVFRWYNFACYLGIK
ncbi:MAG: carboxy-S-adenosyl-L-methionine synthase CmoA [Halobacteriovoraceae bacterium]|jgi:tRNA (cmo5U34)-methyltransferase|nr:carboxy-S-adenosyl-L-methionine synthase CmoA [Halobacteriovoraceae bacterium]MBT5095673.1 carboxy-S-adenosyl-L-methionine synthase CmoA [Halobacteriovoraceae bacterium]